MGSLSSHEAMVITVIRIWIMGWETVNQDLPWLVQIQFSEVNPWLCFIGFMLCCLFTVTLICTLKARNPTSSSEMFFLVSYRKERCQTSCVDKLVLNSWRIQSLHQVESRIFFIQLINLPIGKITGIVSSENLLGRLWLKFRCEGFASVQGENPALVTFEVLA